MACNDIHVDIRTEPRLLGSVRALVHGYLETYGIADERCAEIVLAVDEACTNSIRHAYGGACDKRLTMTLRRTTAHIEIVLSDTGTPAPADLLEKEAVSAPTAQNITPGGLGMTLIQEVFDEVAFQSGKKTGNQLTMRLTMPAEAR